MNQNKKWIVRSLALIAAFFVTGCYPDAELNADYISVFHQTYFSDKKAPLKTGDIKLYVDYSTCIFQAKNDGSTFYKDMLNVMQQATSYYSIKGQKIELEESIKTSTDIYNELAKKMPDIPYANLTQAAEMIASGNNEAILVTDGELFEPNDAKGHEDDAYLREAFTKWLRLGREIFIYCEPYIETYKGQPYDKKRFYFVFTDSDIPGNVYYKIKNGLIPNIEKRTDILQYHLTSSHSFLSTEGQSNSSIPNENLSAKILEAYGYYEVQDWSELSWKNIKKFIINAVNPETGNDLKNGEAVITGLTLDRNAKGSCFRIDDIYLEVSNLTELYQHYCDAIEGGQKPSQIKIEQPMGDSKMYRMGDFMILDRDEFKRTGKIRIFFDKYNFDPTNLQKKSANLLKIDIKVKQYSNAFENNNDARSRFEFDVLGHKGQINRSVVKSIDGVLAERDIRDMMQDRTLYTIYVISNSSNL